MTVIDTTKGKRIAHRTTQGEGIFAKDRWTEFSVYFVPDVQPGGQRFVAEIVGRSNRKGEKDRLTAKASHTLEGALEIFCSMGAPRSRPAAHVIEEARTWGAANCTADGYPQQAPTYTEAQRDHAIMLLSTASILFSTEEMVDKIAEALGMRRAAQ